MSVKLENQKVGVLTITDHDGDKTQLCAQSGYVSCCNYDDHSDGDSSTTNWFPDDLEAIIAWLKAAKAQIEAKR